MPCAKLRHLFLMNCLGNGKRPRSQELQCLVLVSSQIICPTSLSCLSTLRPMHLGSPRLPVSAWKVW